MRPERAPEHRMNTACHRGQRRTGEAPVPPQETGRKKDHGSCGCAFWSGARFLVSCGGQAPSPVPREAQRFQCFRTRFTHLRGFSSNSSSARARTSRSRRMRSLAMRGRSFRQPEDHVSYSLRLFPYRSLLKSTPSKRALNASRGRCGIRQLQLRREKRKNSFGACLWQPGPL